MATAMKPGGRPRAVAVPTAQPEPSDTPEVERRPKKVAVPTAQPEPADTPEIERRAKEVGGLLGYQSLGGDEWQPWYCKPGKEVKAYSATRFGCYPPTFSDFPTGLTGPVTCGICLELPCWLVTLYTDPSDKNPRTGQGCSDPPYNGNLYERTYVLDEAAEITDTANPIPNNESDGGDSLSPGEKAGIAVGAVSALLTLVGVYYTRKTARNRKKRRREHNAGSSQAHVFT
ncbi:hypothetical protein B0H66DRAFT_561074 [Apodospora peruviana]|uniref:Uncharacterized protein n=1 Tax=Apodospora peruviana TaxID=516989 RepID=A0AAE0I0J3_9PEZI|nr:hypothetical protein B0H66DRAFT_561074 [Apodospora peruviana]